MAATLVRRVMLQITADDGDSALKLDRIAAKAEELKALHPDLTPRINTAEAQAKMGVLRDELKATAATADAEPLDIRVASADAQAKLDLIKKNAEELRVLNPTLIPRIDDAEASAKLAVLRGELRDTTAESDRLGKAWEVAKYTLLGLGAGLGYGVVKAAGFNQEMLRVHTQAGVATSQLGSLGNQVLQLAGQVGQSPDSLAESLYHVASNMASLGASAPQMIGAVKTAAEGASVGGADLVDVTNALGAAIASGIPGVQNYQAAMGALNATVGAGDMTMQDLAEAMGTGFLSNVKIYGSTLNDVGAILATFGDNNIRGAHAGTQLRMSVQSLAVQAATATPYLKELGLQAGQLGQYQSIHGTVATINLLVDKLQQSGIARNEWGNIITQLFGKKAGAGIAVLIDQVDRLDSKAKVLTQGAKGFGQAWADQAKAPQQQLKDLEFGAEALATSLGIKLLPIAVAVMGVLNSLLQALERGSPVVTGLAGVIGAVLVGIALKKLEDGLKGAVEGVEGLGKGFGDAWKAARDFSAGFGDTEKAADDATGAWGTFGGKVSSVLGGVKSMAVAAAEKLGLLKTATEGVTEATEGEAGAQEGLDVAMDANPIGIIILAIAGLVIAFAELWKHSAAFRDFWKDAWRDITRAASDAFGWVRSHWPLLAAILTGPVGLATYFITGHWRQITSGAARMVSDVTGFFRSLPGRLLSALGNLAGMLYQAGVNAIKGLLNGFGSMVGSAMSTVAGWGHDIANAIGSPFGIHFSEPSQATQMIKAGRNVALGLAGGMTGSAPLVAAAAQRVARAANPALAGGYGAGGYGAGGGKLQVEWVGGGGADQQFVTWIKRNIRIRGGDVDNMGR